METDFYSVLTGGALIAALAVLPAQAADPFGALEAVPPIAGLQAAPVPCQSADLAKALDLAEAVDLALCNNPQTRQAWGAARVQAAQVGVAQAAFLPALSAGAGVSRARSESAGGDSTVTQRSVDADLSWVLFDFGARSATLENARLLFAAAAFARDATVQAVFLAAVQAFFQRQAAAAALEASGLSEKAALESLNAAEARYRVGAATPADRLQARTAHAQAVLNRINAEGAVKTAQGALANVIGIDPAYDNASIGLSLRIPLFSGYATTYKVHAAEAQAEVQAARREQLRLQVALDVWNAHASLATATQSVKTAGELLDSAAQSERVAAGRYRAGVGSILDLLAAQAALASARQSRIQAGTGWFVSRAGLAQAMGALDARLLTTLSPASPSASGKGE